MTTPEWIGALARYNRWMNDKAYALAATMSDGDRKRDAGAFFRSIHGTFNHLLVADRIWLARLEGAQLPLGDLGPGGIRALDQELYADFDELRRERARTDEALAAYVATLTPERLAGPLVYVRFGLKQEMPLWWAVGQVFNHQTHHRGQITTLFTQQGRDIGSTDLFAMLRDEAATARG